MNTELENALAWFKAAPKQWIASGKHNLQAAAEWIWNVLQGDFAEEQSTAQVVTGTIISMIPLVDQLCDVRDVVANCKKINQDSSNRWAWVALALTLIGLFPALGSLVKGCFKILFAYGRKAMFQAGKAALDNDLWKASQPFVENSIGKLNNFLARTDVRKTLAALKIDNPYRYLAQQLRKVSGSLSTSKLVSQFDTALSTLNTMLEPIKKWGSTALNSQIGQLLVMLKKVRNQADKALGDALDPVQTYLHRLAQRLDVEARLTYGAKTNIPNPHGSTRMQLDEELTQLRKAPPEWVKVGKAGSFPGLDFPPAIPKTHFDIGHRAALPLRGTFQNFHGTIKAEILPPGTVLYRVVDPISVDNNVYWMSQTEFNALRKKTEWREYFAVWKHWNSNGEFLTYTVPPGPGLPVWRGKAASQELKDRAGNSIPADDKGNTFWLEGGREQIAIDPNMLKPAYASKRQFTGWGYDDGDTQVNLIGVPILERNWK